MLLGLGAALFAGNKASNNNFLLLKNGIPDDGVHGALENSNGHFLGAVNTKAAVPELTPANKEWEKWIFVKKPTGYVIKQEVSGLFLGGTKGNNENPVLVEKEGEWEVFQLEAKGNNAIGIKNIDGLYLARKDKKVAWTNNPNQDCLWRVHPAAEQTKVANITLKYFDGLPSIGQHCALVNGNGGYLGVRKEVGEDVGMAPKLDAWEELIFEVVGDKVALKQAVSNNYLGGQCEKGKPVQWAAKRDAWELFDIQNVGNGVVAFKNINGLYISHDTKDHRVVFTDHFGQSEQWKFVPPASLQAQGITQLNQVGMQSSGNQQWWGGKPQQPQQPSPQKPGQQGGFGNQSQGGFGHGQQGGFGTQPQGGFGHGQQGGFGTQHQGGFGNQPQGGFGNQPQGGFGHGQQGGFGTQGGFGVGVAVQGGFGGQGQGGFGAQQPAHGNPWAQQGNPANQGWGQPQGNQGWGQPQGNQGNQGGWR